MLIYGLLINFVYTVCRIFISYIRFAVYNNTEKRPTGSLGSQGMNPRMNPRLRSETLQQPVPVNVNKISLQLPVRIMRILGSRGVYDPQVQGMNPSLKNLPVESTGVWEIMGSRIHGSLGSQASRETQSQKGVKRQTGKSE